MSMVVNKNVYNSAFSHRNIASAAGVSTAQMDSHCSTVPSKANCNRIACTIDSSLSKHRFARAVVAGRQAGYSVAAERGRQALRSAVDVMLHSIAPGGTCSNFQERLIHRCLLPAAAAAAAGGGGGVGGVLKIFIHHEW